MSASQTTRVQMAVALLAAALLLLVGLTFWSWPDENLRIVVCDVGQGDAILLMMGFTQVLVDAGLEGELVLACLRKHMPILDRQIEWVVPSHLDADHIGGFASVMDRFLVKNILLPNDEKQSADFDVFEAAVLREQKEGARLFQPTTGDVLAVHPDWRLSVVFAPVSGPQTETTLWDENQLLTSMPTDSNNRSTILSLQFDQISLLLTGDVEEPIEQALAANGLVEKHTILKVAHHGSKSSTIESFLKKVEPEIALVSSGRNNSYGHPAEQILDRLTAFGVKTVLRTDELGTIVVVTDGVRVWSEHDKPQKEADRFDQLGWQ